MKSLPRTQNKAASSVFHFHLKGSLGTVRKDMVYRWTPPRSRAPEGGSLRTVTEATSEQVPGEAEAGTSHSLPSPSEQIPKSMQETPAGLKAPGSPSSERAGQLRQPVGALPGLRLTGTSWPTGCFHGNEVGLATGPSFKRATCLKEARHAALFLLPFPIPSLEMRCTGWLTWGGGEQTLSLSGP